MAPLARPPVPANARSVFELPSSLVPVTAALVAVFALGPDVSYVFTRPVDGGRRVGATSGVDQGVRPELEAHPST